MYSEATISRAHLGVLKVAGTVLKHANYSLLAVTTVMQYAHIIVRRRVHENYGI